MGDLGVRDCGGVDDPRGEITEAGAKDHTDSGNKRGAAANVCGRGLGAIVEIGAGEIGGREIGNGEVSQRCAMSFAFSVRECAG